MEPAIKSITLYYQHRSSEKIYQVSIHPQGDGYVVAYAFGRRNSMLSGCVKTPLPVDHDTAHRIFDKLVAEKTAKGYSPGPDGVPYHQTKPGRNRKPPGFNASC